MLCQYALPGGEESTLGWGGGGGGGGGGGRERIENIMWL